VGLQGHRPDQGPRRTHHRLLAQRTIGRRMRRNPDDRRTSDEASMPQERDMGLLHIAHQS